LRKGNSMATPKGSNLFMLVLFLWFIVVSFIFVIVDMVMPMSMGVALFVIQFLGFGLPCVVILFHNRGRIKEILPMQRMGGKNILMICAMSLAFVPVLMFIAFVSQLFFTNFFSEAMDQISFEYSLLWALFFIGVVPSVLEELAFRGIIFSGYRDIPIFKAALVNGLFFGIIHMNMHQFFFTAVAGFVWCFMVFYTKSIWAAVLAHFINNGSQVMLTFWGNHLEGAAVYQEPSLAEAILSMGILAAVGMSIFFVIYPRFKVYNICRNTMPQQN